MVLLSGIQQIRFSIIMILLLKDPVLKNISHTKAILVSVTYQTPQPVMIELKSTNSPVFFDSSGYFDGSNVIVIGQMAKQRVGDLLPYDYKFK